MAAVGAGDAVRLASVCQVGDAAWRPSRLGRPSSLTRSTVGSASNPGMASLVTDVSKNIPAFEGVAELLVWVVMELDEACWLLFAA